jgi:alpha-1,3-rhamnosyl/mannosyltransferase
MTSGRRPVVAISTLSVNPSNAGSRTMLTELVPALARVAPELDLLLVCHEGNRHLYPADLESIVVDLGRAQRGRRAAYELVGLGRLIRGRADAIVTATTVGPLRCPVPEVAIVAAHLVLPSCRRAALPARMSRLKELHFATMYPLHLRRADQVLGISDFVAEQLVEELGLPPERVRSMPLGVDVPEGAAATERTDDIFFIGTLYEYKDAVGAVQAFSLARPSLPSGSRLLIAGKDHADQAARVRQVAAACGVADAVELLGPVPDDELERLYRTAGVLLMPSKCEGYGFPVAEAMARGLPVIAADATALPGVAGDAAVLVPPGDAHGFAEALVQVLTDPARRAAMAERGLRRARELSWDNAARILRTAIGAALGDGAATGAPPATGARA